MKFLSIRIAFPQVISPQTTPLALFSDALPGKFRNLWIRQINQVLHG